MSAHTPSRPLACCRAQQRRQRLERLEAQFDQQQAAAAGGGGGGGGAAPAEPHLGDATSEESEGEVAHWSSRQTEVQEAADAGAAAAVGWAGLGAPGWAGLGWRCGGLAAAPPWGAKPAPPATPFCSLSHACRRPPPPPPAVFRDASDEFGSLPAVKRRLEAWKARQPGAYRDAYVSLSAPALFAPWVRLELLKWRPLHGGEPGARAWVCLVGLHAARGRGLVPRGVLLRCLGPAAAPHPAPARRPHLASALHVPT